VEEVVKWGHLVTVRRLTRAAVALNETLGDPTHAAKH
jgi:hypothetical protein